MDKQFTPFPEVMEYIFPSMEIINRSPQVSYITNNIIQRQVIVLGGVGTGKSELIRKVVEYAVEKYGEDNVLAVTSSGSFYHILNNGWLANKPVIIFFVDDLTLTLTSTSPQAKMERENLHYYFKMRHLMKDMTGRTNGLIVTILSLHDYYGSPKSVRGKTDVFLIRDIPTNDFDEKWMRSKLDGMDWRDIRGTNSSKVDFLNKIIMERENESFFKGYSGYITRINSGIFYSNLATKNYQIDIGDIDASTKTEEEPTSIGYMIVFVIVFLLLMIFTFGG